MQLLHIDSSILAGNSVSRPLSAAVVAQMKVNVPDINVTYRDLSADPIPHLSGAYLAAATQGAAEQHDSALQQDLALGARVLEEFLAADIVVIGVAQYNFSVPSQLKSWIDRVAVAGKTFRYTEKGSEGLVGNKRVILAAARGGFYAQGSPTESFEHTLTYLKSVLAFFGITNPEIITADGVAISAEQREASVSAALEQIAALR
ncbi:FMN-dependent NADH-azoreductase [Klebsiella sp. 141203]|uniref:FMN-dependent NADH-azoreductase n=1 Tax=Klebsiella sp. 141203 TaxID=3020035 RepID=UPI0029278E7B|nr:FMN-dependent NADH-azoreductase [Klebsiella sp. 141203]MDU9367303.1 FMN-dependent NADH-azoreductase [Klebsiella sp. 141203]